MCFHHYLLGRRIHNKKNKTKKTAVYCAHFHEYQLYQSLYQSKNVTHYCWRTLKEFHCHETSMNPNVQNLWQGEA